MLLEHIQEARDKGLVPKMLVVINPGNPTGALINPEEIKNILKLAHKEDFVVLADEVYQRNIFNEGEFVSFKKARQQLVEEDPKYDSIQLASCHSTSKGFIGECGQRGGYVELVGFSSDFMDQFYKLASISLCPVVTGQVLTELMVNPPQPGDESYEQFQEETHYIQRTLQERAEHLYHAFDTVDGVDCQPPQGAMYLYPTIHLPQRAIEEAHRQGVAPDEMYCMDLLNNTGICVVPGSGFGQVEGTFHFRTTFLAPGGKDFSQRFIDFHTEFMNKYKN